MGFLDNAGKVAKFAAGVGKDIVKDMEKKGNALTDGKNDMQIKRMMN